jgi:hypothetical protein
MTLGTLAGVIAGLAVFVAAAQIILRLFVWPAFWGIAACVIAICTLLTIWDGHQREIYRKRPANRIYQDGSRSERRLGWRKIRLSRNGGRGVAVKKFNG